MRSLSTDHRQATATLCILILLALLVSSCGINPVTGRREMQLIPQGREVALGQQNFGPAQQAQGGPLAVAPSVTRYISDIGKGLAAVSDRPDLPYEFIVLNNSVPNAWALPGGKIAVNRGLLVELENEAELAAVLAHEIVHAAARHGAKGIERGMLLQMGAAGIGLAASRSPYADLLVGSAVLGANLINQRYSRAQELEADYYGMRYMARAGYAPGAAITLQQKFVALHQQKNPGWLAGLFASHPPSQARVEANRKTAQTLPVEGVLGGRAYRQAIAPLLNHQQAYAAYDDARQAFAAKDYATARIKNRQALDDFPAEALFWGLQGDILARQGEKQQAMAAYNKAIARNANYYRFYQQRGLLAAQMDRNGLARTDLEHSISLLPTAQAHMGLGRLELALGHRAKAKKHFQMAAQGDSDRRHEAATMFALLDFKDNPDHYLAIVPQRNRNQKLLLAITNNGPVAVKNIRLDVRVEYTTGTLFKAQTVILKKALAPGEKRTVRAGISLGATPPARLRVRHRLRSFEPLTPLP